MKFFASLVMGGIIGWAHSWLVIKLVFWPRRPVYVLGRQLPLTPGLFIAGRDRFAREFSKMLVAQFMGPQGVHTALGQVLRSKVVQMALLDIAKDPSTGLKGIVALHAYARVRDVSEDDLAAFSAKVAVGIKESGAVETTIGTHMAAMAPEQVEHMVMAVVHHELRSIIWLGFPLGVLVILVHDLMSWMWE